MSIIITQIPTDKEWDNCNIDIGLYGWFGAPPTGAVV